MARHACFKSRTQVRPKTPQCPQSGPQNLLHVRIPFEHRAEAVFNHDPDPQVASKLFEDVERGSGEDAIAERPKPDDRDTPAGRQRCEDALHALLYSSTLASSTSMTGISSRIG